MKTMEVDTLRQWLADGRAVTVLDVRADADRAEWQIPGSIHVNAYESLKANDRRAMAGVTLPDGVPVVTVCGAGKASVQAAEQLEERGFDVFSLAGGMKAWSLAWNIAAVPAATGARITQVRRTGKGCLSYIVSANRAAAVIDPSLPPDVYLALADRQGLSITHVLETHIHADHLSRARQLAEQAGANLHMPANSRLHFPFTPVREGETLVLGDVRLVALATPGHTLESTTYLLDDAALFTGDTLFGASVGRPDLHADEAEARHKAHLLYGSLQRLARLSPDLLVLPAHTSAPVSFDSAPVASTLGDVLRRTPLLRVAEPEFVDALLSRAGAPPAHFEQIVAANETGTLPEGDPTELEAGANRCAIA